MKIDFDKVASDVDEAVRLVTDAKAEDDKNGAAENLDFYKGEHFGARGEYWTGPRPADPSSSATLDKVKPEFVSKNAVKEVVKGHADGVISREPEWTFTVKRALGKKGDVVNGVALTEDEKPNVDEQTRIGEVNAALTNWWNEKNILKLLRKAVADMLVTRRATLRLYLPPTEAASAATLEEALSKIHLLTHDYTQAGVFRDDRSMRQIGVFTAESDGQTVTEVTYLDAQKQTVLTVNRKDKDAARTPRTPASSEVRSIFSEEGQPAADTQSVTMPLGGRLTMFEMDLGAPLVSTQMRQGNKSLNKAKTLRGHVLNEAGFPETSLFDVELPGKLESDPSRPGGSKFIPDPIQRGASVTNVWQSRTYTDEAGNRRSVNAMVHERDIPSLAAFIECERGDYQDILEESGQVHKLQAGDADSSALSRIQSKAAFGTSMLPTVGEVNAGVRWILESVVAFASWLTGDVERYTGLRANADCRVDTGPVLPDEVRVGEELVEKKVWSRARLQRMTGVEDTEAEDAAILADEAKLNPMEPIRVQRAQIGLEADRRAGQSDAAVRDRIAGGAQDLGGVA